MKAIWSIFTRSINFRSKVIMARTEKVQRSLTLLLGLLVAVNIAQAFELSTHAQLTWNAVNQSILASQTLQNQFGLTPLVMAGDKPISQLGLGTYTLTNKPFGDLFLDVSGSSAISRPPSDSFEGGIIDRLTKRGVPRLSLTGWVMGGAVREDDGAGWIFSADGEPTSPPEADPYGTINRYCNHFFDPYHRSSTQSGALSDGIAPCVYSGGGPYANPDWALGTPDAFAGSPTANPSRRNHFSVQDLYEAMWRATTGTVFPSLAPIDVLPNETADATRQAYWATTFRSLGHLLHLNEDMAQPQHTRNETHGGGYFDIGGHKSQFENYVEGIVLTSSGQPVPTKFELDETSAPLTPVPPPPLDLSGYPVPSFQRLSDFWSSGPGEASHFGFGMADYSNHGFFTPANNIGGIKQPYPDSRANQYTLTKMVVKNSGQSDEIQARYLTGTVHDNQTNADSPVILRSRYSLFSYLISDGTGQFLDANGQVAAYTIDTAIYADEASQLLKRASAYATGITNHVFRGQLEIGAPAQGAYAVADQLNALNGGGFSKVRLTVKNTTPDTTTAQGGDFPQDMAHGVLMLVVRYHENNCYEPDLTGEYGSPGKTLQGCRGDEEVIVRSNTDSTAGTLSDIGLPAGGDAREFNFVLDKPLPIYATDVQLQVVFRGQLGVESDVVSVATKDIPEPTFYSWVNVTDSLLCVQGTWYKRNADGSMPSTVVNSMYQIPPETYQHVATSFRQNASKPYATADGVFAHPLVYPLIGVDNLPPGHFIRFAVLAEDQIPSMGDVTTYGYPTVFVPWDAAVNEAVFSQTGVVLTAATMQTFQGINTFRYEYAYPDFGNDCDADAIPTDMTSADGGKFPDRVQDPAVISDPT